jgi:hypothetical protein
MLGSNRKVVSEKFSKKGRSWYSVGVKKRTLKPKGTMTRKENKRRSQEIKALMSQEEDLLRPLIKVALPVHTGGVHKTRPIIGCVLFDPARHSAAASSPTLLLYFFYS